MSLTTIWVSSPHFLSSLNFTTFKIRPIKKCTLTKTSKKYSLPTDSFIPISKIKFMITSKPLPKHLKSAVRPLKSPLKRRKWESWEEKKRGYQKCIFKKILMVRPKNFWRNLFWETPIFCTDWFINCATTEQTLCLVRSNLLIRCLKKGKVK